SGAFSLVGNGTGDNSGQISFSQTFTPTGTAFGTVNETRADIVAYAGPSVLLTGTAQQGQALTASASTNDSAATIDFQWQESSTPNGTFTPIGSAVAGTDNNGI